MTSLSAALLQARERGEDVRLVAFQTVASVDAVRLAYLVSLSLGLTESMVISVGRQLWDLEDAAQAFEELAAWPIVQRIGAEYVVTPAMAEVLSAEFEFTDPRRFRKAHELFVALEEAAEHESDPDESWFTRGRIAFYLAGVDPGRSLNQFGESFTNAPTADRTVCRMWLTSLVLRQERLLDEKSRELAFYRGFRAYVTGRRADARRFFGEVILGAEQDLYRAVALHLLGVIISARNPATATTHLLESIQLSRRLELFDNEVMARNSVVWALFRQSQLDPGSSKKLRLEARDFALSALSLAQTTTESFLIAFCTRTAIAMEWEVLTAGGRNVTNEALARVEDFLRGLRQAQDVTLRGGDYETFIHLCNTAAVILRDSGRFEEALSEVRKALDEVSHARNLNAVDKMAKTTRSVMVRATDRAIHDQSRQLLRRMSR